MTRKDYELLASAISVNYEFAVKHRKEQPTPDFVIELLTQTLASVLKEDNPKFDKEKFFKACGMGDVTGL